MLHRYHIVTTVLELLKMIRDYVKSAEAIPALLDQALPSAHCALRTRPYAAAECSTERTRVPLSKFSRIRMDPLSQQVVMRLAELLKTFNKRTYELILKGTAMEVRDTCHATQPHAPHAIRTNRSSMVVRWLRALLPSAVL